MKRIPTKGAGRATLALFAFVLIGGGCATKGDVRALRQEMRAMSQRQDSVLVQLQRQAASTQDTLRTQTNRLYEVRGDLATQLQRILDELSAIRALSDQNQRAIASVRDQLDALRRTAVSRPAPAGGDATGSPSGPVEPSGSAEETYNAAVAQFQRGSLTAARLAFEQFVQQYPNHRLTPDAHFYLADILVQEDRLEEAVEAFEEIRERFPESSRVPDALYRIGLLHLELGDPDEARRYLELVVNTYPDAGVALLARERLREIR